MISVNNIDPAAGTYSGFTSVASDTNTFVLTGISDFDSGGSDDTLPFTLTRSTYTAGSISGSNVILGSSNNGGNTNNWYSNFGDKESMQFTISAITYTSGEMDGTTAVFTGFTTVSRVNINDSGVSFDYLIHTGSTISTSSGNTIDLTSAGAAQTVFITAPDAAGGITIRDLDLTFETVPEPSSAALLALGSLALIIRRSK